MKAGRATRWQRFGLAMRERLLRRETVTIGDVRLQVACESAQDIRRTRTLPWKEEGTIAWILEAVQPGDVFVDVGANIGLYSLLAAHRVGEGGMVCAFEPHAVNFLSLLRNIQLNGLDRRIRAFSCALHEQLAVLDFNYREWTSGSAMSQFGGTRDADEREFVPAARERKLGVSLDDLVERFGMARPMHVKIDVDGNELLVVRGMRRILRGPGRPRSVQVEVNQRHRDALFALFAECGYEPCARHDTARGKKKIAAGADPAQVAHNVVLRPRR